MAKTKKKVEEKNVGGRPKKDPAEKARRVVLYLPGTEFRVLLGRAKAGKIEAQRVANSARPRTADEEEDAVVAAYSKIALLRLARTISGSKQ